MMAIPAIPQFPDYQITQLPNLLGAHGDPPRCHSERCRSIRDGVRGTPRMFITTMQRQGIPARARVEQAFMPALKIICNRGFSP